MGEKKNFAKSCCSYPLLNNKIPCASTQDVANEELYRIERDVEDDVEEPHDTSPTPSDPLNCSKTPIGVHRDQSGNLVSQKVKNQFLSR